MEAAYDGPTVPGTPDIELTMISDLLVCEDCIREAAALFDFEDKADLVAELVEQAKYLQNELDSKDKQIIGLTATVEELKAHPIAKLPGKPALIGLSDEDRAEITRRRYETAAKAKSKEPVKA